MKERDNNNKMLSYRRETALQGGLIMAQNERLEHGIQYLRTLYVYLQSLWRNWSTKQSNLVNKTQNKGYYAVQGHSKSSISVLITVTGILYRTVWEIL